MRSDAQVAREKEKRGRSPSRDGEKSQLPASPPPPPPFRSLPFSPALPPLPPPALPLLPPLAVSSALRLGPPCASVGSRRNCRARTTRVARATASVQAAATAAPRARQPPGPPEETARPKALGPAAPPKRPPRPLAPPPPPSPPSLPSPPSPPRPSARPRRAEAPPGIRRAPPPPARIERGARGITQTPRAQPCAHRPRPDAQTGGHQSPARGGASREKRPTARRCRGSEVWRVRKRTEGAGRGGGMGTRSERFGSPRDVSHVRWERDRGAGATLRARPRSAIAARGRARAAPRHRAVAGTDADRAASPVRARRRMPRVQGRGRVSRRDGDAPRRKWAPPARRRIGAGGREAARVWGSQNTGGEPGGTGARRRRSAVRPGSARRARARGAAGLDSTVAGARCGWARPDGRAARAICRFRRGGSRRTAREVERRGTTARGGRGRSKGGGRDRGTGAFRGADRKFESGDQAGKKQQRSVGGERRRWGAAWTR